LIWTEGGGGGGAGTSGAAAKVMSVSLSGKRGRYVRQVTGRHNDTGLHVAARAGDAAALRRALDEAAVVAAAGEAGEELEAVRRAVAAEANEAGETPLLAAAERGHLEVVVELLRHLDAEGVAAKNRSGYDALHVAAREGHHGEISVLSAL
jgi:ankyrin repeat protein